MSVRLSGRLPKDDGDGLAGLQASLEENPFQVISVVGVLGIRRRIANFDKPDDATTLELKFLAIEPLRNGTPQQQALLKMLEEARSERTGVTTFGFDDEGDK